jgi:hypothetical protein
MNIHFTKLILWSLDYSTLLKVIHEVFKQGIGTFSFVEPRGGMWCKIQTKGLILVFGPKTHDQTSLVPNSWHIPIRKFHAYKSFVVDHVCAFTHVCLSVFVLCKMKSKGKEKG